MTKIIEQDEFVGLKVKVMSPDSQPFFNIEQTGDSICIGKQGAAELIKALQEFLDENN